MTRLRTYLKSQGQELVLLVEEFARLQGIDRALLQAITSQGDDRQCKMRTAIAVTTGFFQSVAETAYMRTTHIVDMDRSAGRAEGRSVTQASLSQFTSRYLNAVRLGRDGIEQWSETAAPGEIPRSKCEMCVHQNECHATFGEVDGYGLYPFTPKALWIAASRADKDSMPERLNPRTLTVLSDYGRDRAFYQAFEHLFDPSLEPQHLPIRNPYVMKIQAVFALFDWLAATTAGHEKAWQWNLLSRSLPQASPAERAVLDRTRAKLTQLVQGDAATIDDLRAYLMGALGIDRAAAETLLWEAPRSLLLEAVPTLVRRLFRGWQLAIPNTGATLDLQVDHHPLPDFVPRNLFSDLSLPEVRVIIPSATVNHEERVEQMPILQALNQFVPGRVTRRFAHERGALSHWIPVDPAFPEQTRRISDYALEHEFVGSFTGSLNDHDGGPPLLVCRLVRDGARQTLSEQPSVVDAITAATTLAASDLQRRRNRLQRRQSAGDTMARDDIALIESILPSIASPAIRLDAMGCFILGGTRARSSHG